MNGAIEVRIEKGQSFLEQFGSAEEFLGWCEVQGVKGERYGTYTCLVAQAIMTATGLEEVKVGYGAWRPEGVPLSISLPVALKDVPERFDQGFYPHLIRNTVCPS